MMRMSSRPLAFGAVLALAASLSLVAACGGEVSGGTPAGCATASDCSASPGVVACDSGTCKAPEGPVSCKTDSGCDLFASAVCRDGICARACAADAQCAAGTICAGDVCAAKPSEGECSSSKDCAGKGAFTICRGHQCVRLTSELCTTVHATTADPADAYLDDGAFFFGSILPTTGPDGAIGQVIQDGILLALDEIGAQGGLPPLQPGGAQRPMVLVGCSDGPSEDQAPIAAKHLTGDLGIQAIVGHAFSGSTIAVATSVTIPAGALLFSPSASSDALGTLQDQDLVWSAAAPDSVQGVALDRYYADVEAQARARYPLIGATIRVALVRNTDAYAVGLAARLTAGLSFNGQSASSQLGTTLGVFEYGPANAPSLNAIAKIPDFAPHVIFLIGFQESVSPILATIEQQWKVPAEGHRPFWILGDGGLVPELWEQVITSEDLRTRVTGSRASSHLIDGAAYASFAAAWSASTYGAGVTISPDTVGLTGAHDITYLLGLSAAAVGAAPPTGHTLVQLGLRRMQPTAGAPVVSLGPSTFTSAAMQLAAGMPIDVEGASGSLDFDINGTTSSDTVIWCVPKGIGGNVAGPAIDSGRYHQGKTDQMMGTIDAACGLP